MKKFTAILISFVFIALTSYFLYTIYLLKADNKSINQKLNTITAIQSDTSSGELDYYKKLSTRTVNLLNNQQLVELAKKEWKYVLYINDKEFTGQSINVSGNVIIIKLTENREERSALPEELRLKGQIPGYFYKQIKVESKSQPEITNVDEKYTTSVVYKFDSLNTGDQIKITLSDELKKRLGLKFNTYSINIK